MKFSDYLKERWLTYVFIAACSLFAVVVYRLDRSFDITPSNAAYIVIGLSILLIAFVSADYVILDIRTRKFKNYCEINASSEEPEEFSYPLDKEYLRCIRNISMEYENYKSEVGTKSSEDLEFITKWVHDIKVPISAMKLILESNDSLLPRDIFEKMEIEISKIQQKTQTIFYNIKSNTFYDDYKIGKAGTKKMVSDALKDYSSFFSYKKINISIEGKDYNVLTDEKWSGYIISQIISNAVKYTPVNGNISIRTSRINNKTVISVKNSGKGIHPKDAGQIFNKGYTSSTERSGMNATGYGMYLSKKLCEMLGHELAVKTEYGKYARFDLTFIENKSIHNVTKM